MDSRLLAPAIQQAVDHLEDDLTAAVLHGGVQYNLHPMGTFFRDIQTVLEAVKGCPVELAVPNDSSACTFFGDDQAPA